MIKLLSSKLSFVAIAFLIGGYGGFKIQSNKVTKAKENASFHKGKLEAIEEYVKNLEEQGLVCQEDNQILTDSIISLARIPKTAIYNNIKKQKNRGNAKVTTTNSISD